VVPHWLHPSRTALVGGVARLVDIRTGSRTFGCSAGFVRCELYGRNFQPILAQVRDRNYEFTASSQPLRIRYPA